MTLCRRVGLQLAYALFAIMVSGCAQMMYQGTPPGGVDAHNAAVRACTSNGYPQMLNYTLNSDGHSGTATCANGWNSPRVPISFEY